MVFAADYMVSLDPDAARLAVRVCVDADGPLALRSGAEAAGYLVDATHEDGTPVTIAGSTITTAPLAAGDCVTYRVDLAAATVSRADPAFADEDIWLAEPSDWLWRQSPARSATLTLALPADVAASLPWPPLDASGKHFALPASNASGGSLTAFGRLTRRSIEQGDGRIELAVLAPPGTALAERLTQWQIEASGLLLQAYGQLPLPTTQVLVIPRAGANEPVPWAQSNRSAGVALHFHVDASATLDDLRTDWTAAHEYAHLMHPYLGSDGSWLAEGLASYYQNVLRARAGLVAEAESWRSLHAGFDRGARAPAGPPLEQASRSMRTERNYMRIYWSGAAFWLEADIALRRSGAEGVSVDAALARFSRCCLPPRQSWSPAAFITMLDEGMGTDVFVPLFDRYRRLTAFPDRASADRALGLERDGTFSTQADDAAIELRHAIMGRRAQVDATTRRP